jgi:hypothetical protein
MIPGFPIGLLGGDSDLLLFVHFHSHERFFEPDNYFSSPESHLERFVVSSGIVKPSILRLLLHRSVEDFAAGESSEIMDRDGVALLGLDILAHDASIVAVFSCSKYLTVSSASATFQGFVSYFIRERLCLGRYDG